jgi:hypothetical protein
MCYTNKEVPFDVYVSLVKFDMEPGSPGSIQLLHDIEKAGEENIEIFKNKIIQKLIDYKF